MIAPAGGFREKGSCMVGSSLLVCVFVLGLFAQTAAAQQETITMAVLSVFPTRHETGAKSVAGFLVSTDQGQTWQRRGWRDYNRLFYCEQASDGTIWCACGNGVLRSTDGGYRWRTTTGWEVTEVLKVKAAETDPSLVFASTAYGIFRSTDGGDSWEKNGRGLRRPCSGDICIDRTDPRRVIAATEVGVYLSEDKGDHWTAAGLEGTGVRVVVQDPHDTRRFWLGTEDKGVFSSGDGGRHWEPRTQGIVHPTVYAIAVHPEKQGWIYIGTWGGGVYMSADNGSQWKQSSRGLTDPEVHSILILPSDPRIVFAGTLNRGLFRSTDGGESWQYHCQDDSQIWGMSVRSAQGPK